MRRLHVAAALAGAMAVSAMAQQPEPGPPRAIHGPTTRAQVEAGVRAQFERVDANGDGAITRDEFDAARAAMRAEHDAPPGDAGPPPPPRGDPGMGMMEGMGGHRFDRVDADHDGKVTLAEAQGAAGKLFEMIDTNHDGTISRDERDAARAMMQALHPRRGE